MLNIYDARQRVKFIFIVLALLIAAGFLFVSLQLVEDLSVEEKNKIETWAKAIHVIDEAHPDADLTLALHVIEGNNTIPVILLGKDDTVRQHKNIDDLLLPDGSVPPKVIEKFKKKNKQIRIDLDENNTFYLYYDDSTLLKRLSFYPIIELSVMAIFFIIAVLALSSTKKAEQNQVWVGLSKETAHQLGTPISSLMAWETILKDRYPNDKLLKEAGKDIQRLVTIADRFSKVGSKPELEETDIREVIRKTVNYMSKRVSGKISITAQMPSEPIFAMMCEPLFEWVMENLFKNAVDAMNGQGKISVTMENRGNRVVLYVSDTGKGIAKNKFKTIFHPGYTTKKRGWGLGLSLVKRIIHEYHDGKIYVEKSEINKGTTFCIELRRN